jgi:hypothetical protein
VSLEERMKSWRVTSYFEDDGQRQVFSVVETDPDRPGGMRTVAAPFATYADAERWVDDFRAKVVGGQLREGA